MNRHSFNSTILLSVVLLLAPVLTVAQHQILPDFQAVPSARVFNGRLYIYPSHDLAGNKDWEMLTGTYSPRRTWSIGKIMA